MALVGTSRLPNMRNRRTNVEMTMSAAASGISENTASLPSTRRLLAPPARVPAGLGGRADVGHEAFCLGREAS